MRETHTKVTDFGEARHSLKLRDHSIHKIKNVNYTGVRFEDGQWKLHIGVIKKLPEHDKLLNPDINFSGLPLILDVVGEIKALAANRMVKYRPAPPGISVGHYAITAGTIGVTCLKDGIKHFLSNNHVLANCNAGAIGDAILQPGAYDGGANPADKIGTLAAFVPIVFNDQAHPNHIDCALCLPDDSNDLLDEILELGDTTGSKEAAVGMSVVKSGRTTGITTGTITEFSGLVEIGYGTAGNAFFDDLIATGPMLQGGDSGSCLLDSSDFKAVGLCFAASSFISLACRMTEVVAALGITIFQGVLRHATVITGTATTNTKTRKITLKGTVSYIYKEDPHRYFEWGISPGDYTHTEDCGVGGVGAFIKTVTVEVGTYYYRAKIIDGAHTEYGIEMSVILDPEFPLPQYKTQTFDFGLCATPWHGRSVAIQEGDAWLFGGTSEASILYVIGTGGMRYAVSSDKGMSYGGVTLIPRPANIPSDTDCIWAAHRPSVVIRTSGTPIYMISFDVSSESGVNDLKRITAVSHGGVSSHFFGQPQDVELRIANLGSFRQDWYAYPLMMADDNWIVGIRNPGVFNIYDGDTEQLMFPTSVYLPVMESDSDNNLYLLSAAAGNTGAVTYFAPPLTLEKRTSGGTLLWSKSPVVTSTNNIIVPFSMINVGGILRVLCGEFVGTLQNLLYLELDTADGRIITEDHDVIHGLWPEDDASGLQTFYYPPLPWNSVGYPHDNCSITAFGTTVVIAYGVAGLPNMRIGARIGDKWYQVVGYNPVGVEGISLPWQFHPVNGSSRPKDFAPVISGIYSGGGMGGDSWSSNVLLLEYESAVVPNNAVWYGE